MLDVETDTITAFPSDHYPMIGTIKNIVFKNKDRPTLGTKFCDPSKEEKEHFNNIFKGEMTGKLKNKGEHETEEGVKLLQQSILKAREQAFKKKNQAINKSNISEHTMQLREERQKARNNYDGEKERELHRKVKNSVKKDKRKYWVDRLEKEDWLEIKQTKKGSMPKYTRLKHKDGTIATSAERPDLLADYFEKIQWGNVKPAETKAAHNTTKEFRNNLLFKERANIKTGPYEFQELSVVIKKMKHKKAPGPDEIPADLFKAMDNESLYIVLSIINDWKTGNSLPDVLTKANVVTIFKKGDVEDPGNYRPIALLQSLYKIKIHAALLRNRLIAGLDRRIDNNQYGFRAKRSTTQPLFVARRLNDIAEASGDPLFLVFLDWAKAFDTIDQDELINAVKRFNIPEETLAELKSLYHSVHFK